MVEFATMRLRLGRKTKSPGSSKKGPVLHHAVHMHFMQLSTLPILHLLPKGERAAEWAEATQLDGQSSSARATLHNPGIFVEQSGRGGVFVFSRPKKRYPSPWPELLWDNLNHCNQTVEDLVLSRRGRGPSRSWSR
jgi:hypothetical protein